MKMYFQTYYKRFWGNHFKQSFAQKREENNMYNNKTTLERKKRLTLSWKRNVHF